MSITTVNRKKKYLVRVRDQYGKYFPSKSFERLVDAKNYERKIQTQKYAGKIALRSDQKGLSFADFLEKWKLTCRESVSEGWIISQDQMIRDYIMPIIGKRSINKLQAVDIGTILTILKTKGLSNQTSLHVYNLLHKMFDDAIHYLELLDKNPVIRRLRPKLVPKEREFLHPKELMKLLLHVRNHHFGTPIWLMALTSMRPGEMQALKWSSVDFSNNQILIRATFLNKIGVFQEFPKGKKWTWVPMPPLLKEFLIERSKDRQSGDFVAQGINNDMVSYNTLAKMLKKFCLEAKTKVVTAHELRHSATELYIEQGATAEDIRRLLNHKSLSCTSKYIHRTDNRLKSIANKIDNLPKLQVVGK